VNPRRGRAHRVARYDESVFESVLLAVDARRAARGVGAVLDHRLRPALAGSLARTISLRVLGHVRAPRQLNDVDLVVEDFSALPESLADSFLLNHVHPAAAEGQVLLQLIDESLALRIDVFRAFGRSLSRAVDVASTAPLPVLAVEDLRARATAIVYGCLHRQRPLDPKHVAAMQDLMGLGDRDVLKVAWEEHRQGLSGSFDEAQRKACHLVEERPELLVPDVYSAAIEPCDRCREVGRLRPTDPTRIVSVLGYR
jgi:hypothetical protein